MSYECLGSCSQSSRFESGVSISEFKKLWNIESIGSEAEWRKELKGDRDGGKSQEKYMNEEERRISRLLNYREIIKSIPLFTTPTTVFGTTPEWTTRCDSLTIC